MNDINNNENKFTFETVAALLKAYPDLKRKELQLEFEIKNYSPAISGEDVIESMSLNCVLGEHIQGGQVVDKTANIAISYIEKMNGLNVKHKQELESELHGIQKNVMRMEYYISILDTKHAKILHMLYIEGMTLAEVAEKAGMSIDTVKNQRKAGIKKLTIMLNSIVS